MKILVCDDERAWRESILAEALREEGYYVKTCSSVEESLNIISQEFFHIITIDLSFTDDHEVYEGLEIAQAVKNLNEGTKSIILTGYGTAANATEALRELDAFHFLEKGKAFDEIEFLRVVSEAARLVQMSVTHTPLAESIQKIASSDTIHNIASRLGEKEENIIWLIRNLMNKMHPAIYHVDDGMLLPGDEFLFKKKVWLRMKGTAAYILIGSDLDLDMHCEDPEKDVFAFSETECAKGYVVMHSKISYSDYFNE